MRVLEPRGRLGRLAPLPQQGVDPLAESGIGEELLDPVATDRLEDAPRVVR